MGGGYSVTDGTGLTTGYTFDVTGKLKSVTDGSKTIATYSYNSDSTVAGVDYNTGIKAVYGYDKDKNVTSILNKNPKNGLISSFAYTFDMNGNQIKKTENSETTTYIRF